MVGIALCPIFQYVQTAYHLYLYFHNADNFHLKQTKPPSLFKVRSGHEGENLSVGVKLLWMMLEQNCKNIKILAFSPSPLEF